MAAVFAYPQDAAERRTRVYYFLAFLVAKSCSLALTFVPPKTEGLASLLFGLSVANFFASFILDACARRETRRWAGDTGPETRFWHCLMETFIGQWLTHKIIDKTTRAWQSMSAPARLLYSANRNNQESQAAMVRSSWSRRSLQNKMQDHPPVSLVGCSNATSPSVLTFTCSASKPTPLDEWAKDISFAYSCGIFIKKAIAVAIVVLRFLYDRWDQQPASLDITARVLSSFVSLVLVDVLDGLAKEETRLKSRPVKGGLLGKLLGVFG